MKRHARLARGLALLGGAALFGHVVLGTDLSHTLGVLSHIGPRLAWIVPASLLPFVFDAAALGALLGSIGTRARLAPLLRVTLSVEAAGLLLPGGALLAELLRPFLLEPAAGAPMPTSVAATFVRKALLAMAHGVTLVLCVGLGFGFLAQRSTALTGGPALPFLVLAAGLGVVAIAGVALRGLARGTASKAFAASLAKIPSRRLADWAARRRGSFAEVDVRLAAMFGRGRRAVAPALGLLVLNWLADAFVAFLLLRLVGARLGLVEVLCLDASLSLLRSLAFVVPAGLGVQDLGWATVLGALGVPDAAAFVLLKRGKELLWTAAGGVLLAWSTRAQGPDVAATVASHP